MVPTTWAGWGRNYWHLWGEARDAAKPPTRDNRAPTTRTYPAPLAAEQNSGPRFRPRAYYSPLHENCRTLCLHIPASLCHLRTFGQHLPWATARPFRLGHSVSTCCVPGVALGNKLTLEIKAAISPGGPRPSERQSSISYSPDEHAPSQTRDTQNRRKASLARCSWDGPQPLGPGGELSKDGRGVSPREPSKNNQTGLCKECVAEWKMATWFLLLLSCQGKSNPCSTRFQREQPPFHTASPWLPHHAILGGGAPAGPYQSRFYQSYSYSEHILLI